MRMSEVAERAGVSVATVSRVLSDSPAVRPEYRERVLRTVDQLGYRRNRLASNLRRLRTEMIGIVVSDVENPHFTQMVRKVVDPPPTAGAGGSCSATRTRTARNSALTSGCWRPSGYRG
jgi:DNA-binding LacI/PurR family transcriptional regulator